MKAMHQQLKTNSATTSATKKKLCDLEERYSKYSENASKNILNELNKVFESNIKYKMYDRIGLSLSVDKNNAGLKKITETKLDSAS